MLMDLKIYLLTWNVVGRPPMEDLGSVLEISETANADSLPDIYAIGFQEVSCKPQDLIMDIIFDDPWEVAFKVFLHQWNYVKVKQIRLQGMMLLLFVKRQHITHLRGMQTDYTRTGLKGMWGNKGAVSIRLSAYGCSLCLVNCHLAAHDTELQQRIDEYNTIVDKQKYIDPLTENIITHDYVFWIGDLNFRIDEFTATDICKHVHNKNFKPLLLKDQLTETIRNGFAFSEFTETAPTFPPTYKFYIDGNDYDIQKRKPAWTDRILYRSTKNAYEHVTLDLKQLHYRSHPQYTQSDHKPVTSSFVFKVFKNPVEKTVTFLSISYWKVNQDSAAWYSFNEGSTANIWDWIGLYKDNFSGLDEHICYVWAPIMPSSIPPPLEYENSQETRSNNGNSSQSGSRSIPSRWFKVVFADQNLLAPGVYRLLYISSEFDDVLGVSPPFEILGG